MRRIFSTLFFISLIFSAFSQKAERQNIRKGNKQYNKENYTQAEIDYRKSQEVNPNSPQAAFNLGNALYKQQKYEDAIKQYGISAQNTQDKSVVSETLHNAGNIFMSQQQYDKAIEYYKQSLRQNPSDNETRYNLALAQKLLQNQQQQQDQNKDKDKEDQEQNKNKEKQDQNKDQQQNQDQKQDQDKQDQNKDQNQDQQQEQQQQPQQSDQISKETAEQILNALNQDEKGVQEKVKKAQMQQLQKRKVEKDW
ncbi:MAG: tetratricopeptide repeat protein [Bacteroidales bacterium]|nr:tetratricopeptide repeat protein [Bacteroidales bacterium]